MESETSDLTAHSRCLNCGFEAPPGSEQWDQIEVPRLGEMTRCPDCGSTNVMSGR
ncbi:hypothetical protein [Haloprofundus salilacus]|uniref:hypothetical protein n=1 Tax=Haloprofundus salilacus TaxID=2876190 RepID=UPI001CCD864E|nr:hypothetical protein [Haloprofundus salilacus]